MSENWRRGSLCYTCPGPDSGGNPCTCQRLANEQFCADLPELVEASRKFLDAYKIGDSVEPVFLEAGELPREMWPCDIGIEPNLQEQK